MAVTERHTYGWKMEDLLTPRLEKLFGETITKTLYRYQHNDYSLTLYRGELKSRPYYSSDSFESWMVPCCKFDNDVEDSREICILYHWGGDDTLWYYIYDPDHLQYFTVVENENGQRTYLIPKWLFTPADV